MNALHYMRIIARALDYAKDPDPSHWKTINGSHVHLDKNGNYDGGAGSKFNGRHHYGQGWKEKQAAPKRRSAEEIIYSYEKGPDVKTLPTQVLEEQMKKAANYREWNQARGEIVQRLQNHVQAYRTKFNLASGSAGQKAIGEELDRRKEALADFQKKSAIPIKFMEEAFEHDPERAEKAYREKKFLNEDFYPAYEKWKARKERTTSVLKNLAEAFSPRPRSDSQTEEGENDKAPEDISQILGEEFKGYKGTDAINKLLAEKRGYVKAAFRNKVFGDIALVYGNEKLGLCHIIANRKKQGFTDEKIKALLDSLDDVITNGKIAPSSTGNATYEVYKEGKVAIISPELNGNHFTFVLTAYKSRNKK